MFDNVLFLKLHFLYLFKITGCDTAEAAEQTALNIGLENWALNKEKILITDQPYIFIFPKMSTRFCNEPTKIGHKFIK